MQRFHLWLLPAIFFIFQMYLITTHAEYISFNDGTSESLTWDIDHIDRGMRITVNFPGVEIRSISRDGHEFEQLEIMGCGLKGKTGAPYLPFRGLFVEVPGGVDVRVEAHEKDSSVRLPGYRKIYPAQPPQPDCGTKDSPPEFYFSETLYNSDIKLPESLVQITGDGYIRGRRVLFLEITPVQYNPAKGIVEGFPGLEFELIYSGEADPVYEEKKRRLAAGPFERLAGSVIANYEPVEPTRIKGDRDGAEYLIITHDAFADELQPLAEWKTLKGWEATVTTLTEIGGSTPADIQNYLQNAYDTWTPAPVFVLLVGDVEQMPSNFDSYDLTDLPYSCLDGGDDFADVFLGRLSIQTENKCTTVVDKILQFDRTPEIADWYNSALCAAYLQDTYSPYCEADRWFFETATHVMEYLENVQGMNMYTSYCTNASGCDTYHFRSDSFPHRFNWPDPIPQNLVDLITPASQATSDISWQTDEPADTVLTWGEASPPVNTETEDELTTEHSITLSGLNDCTKYYFKVSSTDAYDNEAADDQGGSFYFFKTYEVMTLFEENMDSDPEWSLSCGLWWFGRPAGLGGYYGGPDPDDGDMTGTAAAGDKYAVNSLNLIITADATGMSAGEYHEAIIKVTENNSDFNIPVSISVTDQPTPTSEPTVTPSQTPTVTPNVTPTDISTYTPTNTPTHAPIPANGTVGAGILLILSTAVLILFRNADAPAQ